jgi:hypothetical protein
MVLPILCFGFLSTAAAGRETASRRAGASPAADQLGKVNFPTSCTAPAQPTMEKGVALLHSFQYQEAEATFTEAAKQDPKCAMAYWGKAMARYHQLWDFPQAETLKAGREDIEKAQEAGRVTDREIGYIAAAAAFYQDDAKLSHAERTAAYSSAMGRLHSLEPKDNEAAAFYALSLIALAELEHVDETANLKKAIAILDPLFRAEPDNPGPAHYLIHATDTSEFAPLGLDAARRYAQIAPDSSHALHMPSHIFTRLGLWQESIKSNIAAAASAAKATEEHRAEAHYQFHAMDYLDYSYLQSGQEKKARQIVEDAKNVPGATEEQKADKIAFYEAQNAIELHRWKEAASLAVPAIRPRWQDTTYLARVIGAARSGDAEGARKDMEKLREAVAQREAYSKEQGYAPANGTPTDVMEAEAWLAYAEGKSDEAIKQMRAAAQQEDGANLSSVAMPAREMLADLLLELKRPNEALAEYKATLEELPNRFDALYGAARAAQTSGDASSAKRYFAKLMEISGPGADRPELAETKPYLAKE